MWYTSRHPQSILPCAEHTFLFVDESTSAPGKKQRRRKDIRSHVRKHVLTEDRRKTSKASSKEDNEAARLKPATMPVEIINYVEAKIGNSRSQASSATTGVYGRNEAALVDFHGNIHISNAKTPFSYSKASKDKYVTRAPDTAIQTLVTAPTGHFTIQEGRLAYCVHCRAHEDAIERRKQLKNSQESLATTKVLRRDPVNTSPFQVLGAGRVDPFSSYPVDKPRGRLHELVDHGKIAVP